MSVANGKGIPAWAAALTSLGLILCANAIAIAERSGELLLSTADEGLVSDLARLLCYYAVGILLYCARRTLWSAFLWIVALNLLDKVLMVLRVAMEADQSAALTASKHLVAGLAIYGATLPLVVAVMCAGYFTVACFSRNRDPLGASAALGSTFLSFAFSALLFPIAYMVSFYAVLLTYDLPVFYLTLSYKSLTPAFFLFAAGTVLAASAWVTVALSSKAATFFPRIVVGSLVFVGAVLLHIATNGPKG